MPCASQPVLRISRDRLFLETYTQPTRNSYPTLNGISHLSHFGWENLLYPLKKEIIHVVGPPCVWCDASHPP